MMYVTECGILITTHFIAYISDVFLHSFEPFICICS